MAASNNSSIVVVVNTCWDLLESEMIISVPNATRLMAVTSYLATNFSPRILVEIYTFMRTADEELQAISVRSANGSATKCPKKPIKTKKRPHAPFQLQNTVLEMALSEDSVYFFFSSSI